MNETEYTRLTYDLTLGWAKVLARINPAITFIYVSGAGTGGKAMWAQVKGRTEEALLELFPNAYMFRIGALRAMHGEVSRHGGHVFFTVPPVLYCHCYSCSRPGQ